MQIRTGGLLMLGLLCLTIWTPNIRTWLHGDATCNPMALMDSRLGRLVSMLVVDHAERSFHDGVPHRGGVSITMMEGLIKCYSVRNNTPTKQEHLANLMIAERLLAAAFWMAPGYYPAYMAYFGFLTGEIEGPEIKDGAGKAIEITQVALKSYSRKSPEECLDAAMANYNMYILTRKEKGAVTIESTEMTMSSLLNASRELTATEKINGGWGERSESRQGAYAESYQYVSRIRASLLQKMAITRKNEQKPFTKHPSGDKTK